MQSAQRAQLALDMNTRFCLKVLAQGMGHKMQGVFVLRAVRNGVDRPRVGLRVGLDPALEQNDELAFPRGWGAVEEQHPPPNVRAHRRRLKWVCPTFYTHGSSAICGPFSRKSAMSRERYLIA